MQTFGADSRFVPTRYAGIEVRAMQTILVIDDGESLRDTVGVMLEQEGFRAVLAREEMSRNSDA